MSVLTVFISDRIIAAALVDCARREVMSDFTVVSDVVRSENYKKYFLILND